MAANGVNRNNLKERLVKELRKGKPWQPDILLVKGDSGLMVVKDYRNRPFLYRVGIGLLSVWHENNMYNKVAGIQGIPKSYGRLDRHAIMIEYIPGRNGSEVKRGELPAEFFEKLENIVNKIHQRGIVLCDMRNRKNVLVTDTDEPYVIDLCTAFQRGSRWNFIRRFLYDTFHQDDLLGIAKLKSKLLPQLLSPSEAQKLKDGLFLQREAMAVRDFCVRWLKKMVATH